MRSISAAAAALCLWPLAARAQQVEGFAVERLVPAAPGAGFFVLDDLAWPRALGGAASFSLGYAHRPFVARSADGARALAVVEHQAFAAIGLAVGWDRFRAWASFASPLVVRGQSGVVDGFQLTGPSADLEQNPDTLSDVQLGLGARLVGEATSPLRLGASLQLFAPSGDRADYLTDNTYRGALRLLAAGELGPLTLAGHLGVHLRPLDDGPAPGSPRGSELLFGLAAAAQVPAGSLSLRVGPELFGATALRRAFGGETTALEGLLTARLQAPRAGGGRLEFKLGIGAGLQARFGAPAWRAVAGVELGGELQAEAAVNPR